MSQEGLFSVPLLMTVQLCITYQNHPRTHVTAQALTQLREDNSPDERYQKTKYTCFNPKVLFPFFFRMCLQLIPCAPTCLRHLRQFIGLELFLAKASHSVFLNRTSQ